MERILPPNFAHLTEHIGAPNRTNDGYLTLVPGFLSRRIPFIKAIIVYAHDSSSGEWAKIGTFFTGKFDEDPSQITIICDDTGRRTHMSDGHVEFDLLDTERIDWMSPGNLTYVLRVYR